jgi:hypothetical protein
MITQRDSDGHLYYIGRKKGGARYNSKTKNVCGQDAGFVVFTNILILAPTLTLLVINIWLNPLLSVSVQGILTFMLVLSCTASIVALMKCTMSDPGFIAHVKNQSKQYETEKVKYQVKYKTKN